MMYESEPRWIAAMRRSETERLRKAHPKWTWLEIAEAVRRIMEKVERCPMRR